MKGKGHAPRQERTSGEKTTQHEGSPREARHTQENEPTSSKNLVQEAVITQVRQIGSASTKGNQGEADANKRAHGGVSELGIEAPEADNGRLTRRTRLSRVRDHLKAAVKVALFMDSKKT